MFFSIESNQYKATSHDGIGEECEKQISNQPKNHPILATSIGGGVPNSAKRWRVVGEVLPGGLAGGRGARAEEC